MGISQSFQESIAAQFFEKLVQWSRNIKISDPLEEGCRLGPVVSGGQVYFSSPAGSVLYGSEAYWLVHVYEYIIILRLLLICEDALFRVFGYNKSLDQFTNHCK